MSLLRWPIGFIVEGHGEFKSFPSLFSKLKCPWSVPPPRIRAQGNGDIICNIKERLTDMANSYSPLTIIICLDLLDAIRQYEWCTSCKDLKEHLEKEVSQWSEDYTNTEKKPKNIVIIIVIPKFESWLIADMNAIKQVTNLEDLSEFGFPEEWENVDNEVKNPIKKLGMVFPNEDVKKPSFVKSIISKSDIDTMSNSSRSFRKFLKEVKMAMRDYLQ